MKRYKYIARNQEGELVKGVVYGINESECIAQLRSSNCYPMKLRLIRWGKGGVFSYCKKVQSAEIGVFCKQLSVLLQAGIALPQALKFTNCQKISPVLQRIISELLQSLEQGETLYQGFSKNKEQLPQFFCPLVRAGEETNSLYLVLDRLSKYYEEQDRFLKQVHQMMVYPLILIICTLAVVFFLFIKIIPGFQEIYEGFEVNLPMITYCLLSISNHIITNIRIYLIGFPMCVFSLLYIFKTPMFRRYLIYSQYFLPIWGTFQKKVLTSRLARTWGLFLENGLELLPAIELTKGTSGLVVDEFLWKISLNLKKGMTLTHSIKASNFFPELFIEMIRIGEESGYLVVMLNKVAEIYEKNCQTQIEKFLTILEPALLAGIALIVGIIVLAIMVPMFNLIEII